MNEWVPVAYRWKNERWNGKLDFGSKLTIVWPLYHTMALYTMWYLNNGFSGIRVVRSFVFCAMFSICFFGVSFCPLLLVIVLSVLYFWSLCCLFFTFGHCVVCPLLLVIVLSVLTWNQDLSLRYPPSKLLIFQLYIPPYRMTN